MRNYCQHCGEEVRENEEAKERIYSVQEEDENDERTYHHSCLHKEIPRCNDARGYLLGEYKHVLVVAVNVRFLYGTSSKAAITKRDRKIKRERKLQEIIRKVSALRNSGGGCVLIQLLGKDPYDTYTGALDEFLDSKLKMLLDDGELFTDVFVKSSLGNIITWCQLHEMMVLSVESSPRMITTDIKTKVSLDDGISTPSTNEFVRFLRKGFNTSSDNFHTQHPKKMEPNNLTSLHESRCVQLKGSSFQKETEDAKLFQKLFSELRLHEYVSAFSKLKGGGSYFLGVAEVETHNGHYISKRADVQGIILHESEEDVVARQIITRLKEEILIYDYHCNELLTCEDLVKVYVIPVGKTADRFVLQIAVSSMPGIVFCDKSGPMAYTIAARFDMGQSERIQRIPLHYWFKHLRAVIDVDLREKSIFAHPKPKKLALPWTSATFSKPISETVSGHDNACYNQKTDITNITDDDIEVDGDSQSEFSLSTEKKTVRKSDKPSKKAIAGSRNSYSTKVISTYQYYVTNDEDYIPLKSNSVTRRCIIQVVRKMQRVNSQSGGRIRNSFKNMNHERGNLDRRNQKEN